MHNIEYALHKVKLFVKSHIFELMKIFVTLSGGEKEKPRNHVIVIDHSLLERSM